MALIIRAVPELPMLPREPTCPAALKVSGCSSEKRGVVCRIMERDQQDDPGLDMSAGQLGTLRDTEGGVYISAEHDPSTLAMFCHGGAVPVVTNDDGQGRASYTYCSTWQEHRDRHLAGVESLTDPVVAEPVSMGLDEPAHTLEASDPWAQAYEDLDLLAPDGVAAGWH